MSVQLADVSDNNELTLATVSKYVRIVPASECALIMYIDQPLSNTLVTLLKNIAAKIVEIGETTRFDIVPSYASLLVSYNPISTDHFAVKQVINQAIELALEIMSSTGNKKTIATNIIKLPVYYSGQTGPDLARIAAHHKLSIEDVIQIHQREVYQVYTIGFAPGFAYLGQVSSNIAMPRLSTPRDKVPKGAVAIADRQTAVYPAESPGGWNIIGQCPIDMFTPNNCPSMPVKVGDSVCFEAINKSQYLALGGAL